MKKRSNPAQAPDREQDRLDLERALEAMTAEELRAVVRDAVGRLDEKPRVEFMDIVTAAAARGCSGWKPAKPPGRIAAEAQEFANAARHAGGAEPKDVDAYLRKGTKAFLAGEHAAARAVFEALLVPVAEGDIDLGQDEMVDEVLLNGVHECSAQYVASVYLTTPLQRRADAVYRALYAVQGITSFVEPLADVERAATAPLPELDAFLPLWVRHLEVQPCREGEWEWCRDNWLREAVLRLEGAAGLERIASATKKPEAFRAWCGELERTGAWDEALRASEEAAKLAGEAYWRGEFLDAAALAAQQLGRSDAAGRLEAAWIGAPSMERLLRWLGAGSPSAAALAQRAREAIEHCSSKAGEQIGLLYLLCGDDRAAAGRLAKAPGLGWWGMDHPGHLLFAAFAGLLAEGRKAPLASEFFAVLHGPAGDAPRGGPDGRTAAAPSLATPSIGELIDAARPPATVDAGARAVMLKAMQTAAAKRVEALAGAKRSRHYDHAARLIACCAEVAGSAGQEAAVALWIAGLRREYSRYPAFQGQLEIALSSGPRPAGTRRPAARRGFPLR